MASTSAPVTNPRTKRRSTNTYTTAHACGIEDQHTDTGANTCDREGQHTHASANARSIKDRDGHFSANGRGHEGRDGHSGVNAHSYGDWGQYTHTHGCCDSRAHSDANVRSGGDGRAHSYANGCGSRSIRRWRLPGPLGTRTGDVPRLRHGQPMPHHLRQPLLRRIRPRTDRLRSSGRVVQHQR